MRPRLLFALICFLLFPISVFGANEFNYAEINQGDWAVVLVRGLNLDENRELVKVEDFTTLLAENGIAPKDGWQVKQKLTYQDFAGTIGLALIHLNGKDSQKKATDFNKFLSFLDNKIGLNIAQLLASLQKSENLRNLNEGISNYLAQKDEATLSDNNTQPAASSEARGSTSNPRLSGGPYITFITTIIEDLEDALNVYIGGPTQPSYWDVFSKPASPILPYTPR